MMGRAKNKLIEEQERGWSSVGDKYVCAECFEDEAIRRFIREHAMKRRCTYCGRVNRGKPIAAHMEEVMQLIADGIFSEWEDAMNSLGWDSSEGGWQGEVVDTWELLEYTGLIIHEDSLREDILNALGMDTEWCRKDPCGETEDEGLYFDVFL